MAEVLVQNMRNPSQTVSIMVTIKRMIIPEEGSGGALWVLEASTNEVNADGDYIAPAKKWLTDKTTLTEDINALIDSICEQIPWEYIEDTEPPKVVTHWPLAGSQAVSPETAITINLEEEIPSSGIDLNSIRVKVKGFDLTDQVTVEGNMNACRVTLVPGTKYMSAQNEDFHNGSEYTPD
jgi:hypothetical protein